MKRENKNNKKTLTPNEINKYLYCPYQWYYERYYGRTELRKLYNEKNKNLKLENKLYSNYKKGLKFHENYLSEEILKNKFVNIILLIILIIIFFILLYFF